MIDVSFSLKETIEQPAFDIIDTKSKSRISCMYDTGATISVWTKKPELFFKLLSPVTTNLFSKVTGYDDKEYNMLPVYTINLNIGKYGLFNIPIVLFPNESNRSMLILAHTLFRFQDVRLVGSNLSISLDTPNRFKFYPLKKDNDGYVYSVYSQSEQLNVCPLCGSKLLSTGLCCNPICEYTNMIKDYIE